MSAGPTELCSTLTEYGVFMNFLHNRQLHKINICFLLPVVFIVPYVLTGHETECILGNKGLCLVTEFHVNELLFLKCMKLRIFQRKVIINIY